MPVITVELWEGRTIEIKKELVKKITDVVCETLKCPKESVIIKFYDIPKYNWAQNGSLASENNNSK